VALATSLMPPSEFVDHPLQRQPPGLEHHQHVIEEIGDFLNDLMITATRYRVRLGTLSRAPRTASALEEFEFRSPTTVSGPEVASRLGSGAKLAPSRPVGTGYILSTSARSRVLISAAGRCTL
jgi:hypothetical protein